jgi:hypothetical protein
MSTSFPSGLGVGLFCWAKNIKGENIKIKEKMFSLKNLYFIN